MKKLLCWLGFHKWIVKLPSGNPYNAIKDGLYPKRECMRCGKKQLKFNGWFTYKEDE